MLTTTHTLSGQEAFDIKRTLLQAALSTAFVHALDDPTLLARGLIAAFRVVDEATKPASSDGAAA
jgi:hypothetical protein